MNADKMMQHIVDLARAATGATVAELWVDTTPPLHVISRTNPEQDEGSLGLTSSTSSQGVAVSDASTDASVAPWVGSYAMAPVTGPSAESGWLAIASDRVGAIDERHLLPLANSTSLIEDRLDRTAEQLRLDTVGELLREQQKDLQATRDRLQVSNLELEQFAYIAAHELVAPLRAVAVYAELLENLVQYATKQSADQAMRCATEIRDGVTLMNQQVQYLLALSRAETDTSDLEDVELGFVVNEALDTMNDALEEVAAEVEVGPLPKVAGRAVPLQSVFANLISNAIRYREPSRVLKIGIDAVPTDGGWKVRFTDNGRGVQQADRARIFQLFERAATDTPGSGVGLALTRRILEAFGATIAVAEPEGPGSEFAVWFPAPAAARSALA